MPYPELMIAPIREDLSRIGVQELTTADQVDALFGSAEGTTLLLVNSVCGCAASSARPALMLALQSGVKPDRVASVFAGQDAEATQRARDYFPDYPPTSPSFILLRDGKAMHYIPRDRIEGRDAETIAGELVEKLHVLAPNTEA